MQQLLRIPLFQKILLANSAIVALGALAGTSIILRDCPMASERFNPLPRTIK